MQEAAFAAAQGQFDWRENGRRFVAAARAALARDQSGR
jgi:hypothetical protein